MPKLTKAAQAERADALAKLREVLSPGDTVHTILRHVSRSGMMRHISLVIVDPRDGALFDITWLAAKALQEPVDRSSGGIKVGGCGMDMGYHLVYHLSYTLFPDGFGDLSVTDGVAGRVRPPSREKAAEYVGQGYVFRGRNGDPSGWDNDGGYALKHRWL